ncbi:putative ethanolamine-phosphate cytidylyltransferase [Babesia divergens]|uniref:ethanolamine-phosphate cytidylyltransferase n=1 Tax=Babesia divergens TaxID=32595 RepID=A0AAD9GFF3_BABDI|nr:putative ethanolamine-phosphate cytidylyltransferase [Babesia divergens]
MEHQSGNQRRRIYVDGVFDLLHWGHLNALRQSRELGGDIVVGVVSDEETKNTKGIEPIYNSQERAELIRGCRWVDEVIVDTPYEVSLDFLANIAKCDIVAHGDDIAIGSSGKDCYDEPKRAGKLIHFKRSRGCSTSTTLGRLVEALTSDRFSHFAGDTNGESAVSQFEALVEKNEAHMSREQFADDGLQEIETELPKQGMHVRFPRCRTSATLFAKFIPNTPKPPKAKVVYVDGSFDVFHVGHLRFLECAKQMGDYLIVGLYDDQTVRTIKGNPFPITHLMDRALNVLAMKYTDDVILGAPFIPSKNYLENLGVSLVVVGNHSDDRLMTRDFNPHSVAKDLGILCKIESKSTITSTEIIQRVHSRLHRIASNVERRCQREKTLYH